MMQQTSAPIGVFDSGLGGLSVLAHLYRRLPHERYLYLADTQHLPYGSRSAQDIRKLTIDAVSWLVAQGCKLVVIACNSASAHGLAAARSVFPNLPIVGLVPALKPAVRASSSKQVAVLATPATLGGSLLNSVIEEFAKPNGVTVHKHSLASLVPWVEAGMPSDYPAVGELDALLIELSRHQVDYLVLGCTHYPFFRGYISERLNELMPKNTLPQALPARSNAQNQACRLPRDWQLTLIDSGRAIAERVYSLLTANKQLNLSSLPASLTFFTTGDGQDSLACQAIAERLLVNVLPPLTVRFSPIVLP